MIYNRIGGMHKLSKNIYYYLKISVLYNSHIFVWCVYPLENLIPDPLLHTTFAE